VIINTPPTPRTEADILDSVRAAMEADYPTVRLPEPQPIQPVQSNAPVNNDPGVDITPAEQVESFDDLFAPLNELATEPVNPGEKYPATLEGWALWATERGWYVFPCLPCKKSPACSHGFKDATNDPSQVRRWYAENSDYNYGIALGASNLVVGDFDTAKPFISGVPFADDVPTFTVQTGRPVKDGIAGIQKYYSGSCKTRNMYVTAEGQPSSDESSNGVENQKIGEIRSRGAYVKASLL
jgi:bifunctional DNA primase/polymerase-like protein